jgi:hypothetical protein
VGTYRKRHQLRGYKRVGRRWAHLDREQRAALGTVGLWVDTTDLTAEQTVDVILARVGTRPVSADA